jgi:hypothetical protein
MYMVEAATRALNETTGKQVQHNNQTGKQELIMCGHNDSGHYWPPIAIRPVFEY